MRNPIAIRFNPFDVKTDKMLKLSGLQKKDSSESLLVGALFVFLWVYLIIRANTVFYVHDEIVTKWAYMISWNPFPYQGYIDANNHFLNSLLGGLFIRLFKSDSMWVVRLPNILSFPLFFLVGSWFARIL